MHSLLTKTQGLEAIHVPIHGKEGGDHSLQGHSEAGESTQETENTRGLAGAWVEVVGVVEGGDEKVMKDKRGQ